MKKYIYDLVQSISRFLIKRFDKKEVYSNQLLFHDDTTLDLTIVVAIFIEEGAIGGNKESLICFPSDDLLPFCP